MPVSAEPADEFERGLGEALEGFIDQGKGLPGFSQFPFLLGQTFLFPLHFGNIFRSLPGGIHHHRRRGYISLSRLFQMGL